MTHRVHTILSLLAEDHAPAALRPSILLAVDWPTVAEEAPATGDDSGIACAASGILSGIGGRENLPALTLATLPLLAARLATVAASLTTTGDKAMAAHADALWGAAAALVGMTNDARLAASEEGRRGLLRDAMESVNECARLTAKLDALAAKAADIVPGVIAAGPAEKATLIATALDRVREYRNNGTAEAFGRGVKIRAALGIMPGADILGALAILRETLFASNGIGIMSAASMQAENLNLARQGRDRALGDIHALRDILKVPEDGNLVDHASAFAERHSRMHAENTRLRAQVDRMSAAMREDAPAPVKPRPQPGDVAPWAEVEDGALYAKDWGGCRFVMVARGERSVASGPEDRDIETFLLRHDALPPAGEKEMTLVARDLGANPEAWRKAMREWTASESSRPR